MNQHASYDVGKPAAIRDQSQQEAIAHDQLQNGEVIRIKRLLTAAFYPASNLEPTVSAMHPENTQASPRLRPEQPW